MRLFTKPFGEYFRETCAGLWLLLAVGVVRFLLKPALGIPYSDGTWFSSLTILVMVLTVVYAVIAERRGETYRDLLGIAVALSFTTAAIVIAAIAVDEFAGIDTYYTDLAHGGNLSPLAHMGGHLLGALFGALFGWGIGALAFTASRAIGRTPATSSGRTRR
jgi:hypothetical protein